MPVLRLDRVAFSYGPCSIFDNLNLLFEAGWTALVGPNGGGKTTLLRLLAGELQPTSGHILRPSQSLSLCPQRVDCRGAAIEALAWAWDRRAIRLRASLRLRPEDLDRWSTLSPGERKRWQIAGAMYTEPEVLLLDEPSNHLDAPARELLLETLAAYRGIGLLVSHDRGLLDALCQEVVMLRNRSAARFRGNYSAARAQREQDDRELRQAHAEGRAHERALRTRLATSRRKQAQAQRKRSSGTRMKGPRDSDARSSAAKARANNGEARLSRRVGLSRRLSEQASAERASIHVPKERGRSLFVDYEPAPMSPVLSLHSETLCVGDRVLLRDLRLQLLRGARIRLSGGNGSGKTSLLRALMQSAGARAEHFLYLPQEIKGPVERDADERCFNILAALGVDPGRMRASGSPSPGELRKLALARGLARGAWALLLDEPTNHLDLVSIEALQEALAQYPGALLLVSHDDAFAEALTDESWHIEEQHLVQR